MTARCGASSRSRCRCSSRSDRLEALAEQDPALRERQPFKAFLDRDMKTIHALGKQAVFEMAFTTHAGVKNEEFDRIARDLASPTPGTPSSGGCSRNASTARRSSCCAYLRANGFKTYIVSGGGIDLIRAFAEEAYGIPREQVIGSSVRTRFDAEAGRIDLLKLAELNSFDDREAKAENIGLHIGRRPILAFGNSDGDLAMLR